MSNCLIKKDVTINESMGFLCEKLEYSELDLSLWVS
jgi:hypothetical protein